MLLNASPMPMELTVHPAELGKRKPLPLTAPLMLLDHWVFLTRTRPNRKNFELISLNPGDISRSQTSLHAAKTILLDD